ncbi:uncharacterized protein Z520_02927 [Fonsecaea multimorphosa CBS 102226]|uniref:Metallo-beta-lactamase domain-containing protein n=1 Tax=Fonsecaea multimorphosa CBS 102226 TaxID=1442371 RepID=A0A0D2KDP9_9EURO|nr:uncharacterized protein Z520_02927 [Fonsecaea multimorphosa CBS 102226]KIY01375.1 hypothetical protein Z520_02927 [Fonsecaea multimorphosa CBS 102226]OAL28392.1 hypothetical protein AYO22_02846 [Fonsecaea multimorphosa]
MILKNFLLPDSAPRLDISALPTSRLQLPDRWLFEDGNVDTQVARQDSPVYSFLISHPSGKHILFDLGLRKELENNPDVIRNDYGAISPEAPKDAVNLLAEGPVSASDIDAVVFSHLHFDHTGDCTKFPQASLIVGPGSRAATTPGWPKDPASPFLSSILDHPKFRELSFERETWIELGPFERTYDYFGDGSLYLVDTPGHMPGHLGALVHSGPGEWVFTGGDCCHHRSLLMGRRPMSVTVGPNGTKSFHKDPETAKRTIERVRDLDNDESFLVALPHDATLDGIMPLYPEKLNGWRNSQWKKDLDTRIATLFP